MIENSRNFFVYLRNHDSPNDDIHRKRSKYRGRAPINSRIIHDVTGIDAGYDESRESNCEQSFISLEDSHVRRSAR